MEKLEESQRIRQIEAKEMLKAMEEQYKAQLTCKSWIACLRPFLNRHNSQGCACRSVDLPDSAERDFGAAWYTFDPTYDNTRSCRRRATNAGVG